MALQPYHLFVHADLVRVESRLLQNPCLIDLCVLQNLLHSRIQTGPVFLQNHRRVCPDLLHALLKTVQLMQKVFRNKGALPLPCLHELLRGLLHARKERLQKLCVLFVLLFQSEDLRILGQLLRRQIHRQTVILRYRPDALQIFPGECTVVMHPGRGLVQVLIADVDIHLAAENPLLQLLTDLRLERIQLLRQPDVQIQIPVVDGFDLRCKFSSTVGHLCAPVPCHAGCHIRPLF